MKTRAVLFLFLAAPLASCGVKGKPLPPIDAMPLSDGTLSSRKYQKKKPPSSTPEPSPARPDETGP